MPRTGRLLDALLCRMRNLPRPYRLRVALRARTTAGSALILLMWGAAQVVAQGATTGAIDNTPIGAQTLNCVVNEALPNPPETAAEGGFSFYFQSLAGVATDGRACTVHRVMNAAGGPPTPVRWLAGDEPLIEMARLGRCNEDAPCEWFAVARYFDGGFDHGPSRLGFGLNADAFEMGTQSLLAVTNPNVGGLTASVGTEVAGTVETADGRSLAVAFTVKSRLVRSDGGAMSLIYEVVTTSPELRPGGELALVWQVFELVQAAAAAVADDGDAPFLVLEPARAAAGTGTVVLGPDSYAVHVPAEELSYSPELTISVVERSRPEETLLVVPMPAFLPVR